MQTLKRRCVHGIALTALLAAFTVGMNGCSDAQGLESPLDASLAAADQGGLSGTWVLNPELSDVPDHMGPGNRPDFGADKPGRPGRFGGEPPNIGERNRPGRPLGGEGMGPGGPRGLPTTLEISQTDQAVTFAGPGDRQHTLYTDGRVETHELPNGNEVQVQAAWSGAVLVIVRSGPMGSHTDSFALSDDNQRLMVTTRIEGGELVEAREFTRVYDRS